MAPHSQETDRSPREREPNYALHHAILFVWCTAALGTAFLGLWPLLALGIPALLFGLKPPVRFMRGGHLHPGQESRWKRRAYRLSDWPAMLRRARFAIPAWIVLVLVVLQAGPADGRTFATVIGLGFWAVWLSLSFTSQRGLLDYRSIPLQAIPLALLSACLLFSIAPNEAVNLTGVSIKIAGTRAKPRGVDLFGMYFGTTNAHIDLIPDWKPEVEPSGPESLRDLIRREQLNHEYFQRRRLEDGGER